MRDLVLLQKQIEKSKEDIKNLNISGLYEEVRIHSLVQACFTIILKFLDNVKKLLRKSETKTQFDETTIGHLVPLTVGHRDRPTEQEVRYIKTVVRHSGFFYQDEQLQFAQTMGPNPYFAQSAGPIG